MEARVAAVDPLPFVPAISPLGNDCSGWLIARNNTRMCARSNLFDGVLASSWPSANMLATAAS